MGGSIPTDFGIIGYDGVFLDQIAFPQLTTVKQPVIQMGEACAKMVLNKIEQKNASQGELFFTPELIVRGTTIQKKSSQNVKHLF